MIRSPVGGRAVTKLTIDPDLRAKLNQSLELTDDAGRTLGFFLTPEEHARLRQVEEEQRRRDYARAHALFTDEALDAAKQRGGEHTTEEVNRYLQSLDRGARAARDLNRQP
jgi:hypothetical protein